MRFRLHPRQRALPLVILLPIANLCFYISLFRIFENQRITHDLFHQVTQARLLGDYDKSSIYNLTVQVSDSRWIGTGQRS